MLETAEMQSREIEIREIQTRLSRYLDAPITRLSVLASGWETTVFQFVLESGSSRHREIPPGIPIVLRFYQDSVADAKGAREYLTIARLHAVGYPVPRPYLYEPNHDALGAPFLIMQRLAGGPLLTVRSFPEAFKTFSLGFFSFVRAQAQLHKLDSSSVGLRDFPRAYATDKASHTAPLLERVLAVIGDRIERGPLPGLRVAFDRACERANEFRAEKPSLVHLDYHPLNVMVQNVRVTGVLDWSNADVGDRHLDAAITSMILSAWALEKPSWMRDNFIGNALRANFAALYLPLYHAMAPMDLARFRYCQSVAGLLRLSMYGMMRTRGPESIGYRAESVSEVTPPAIRALSRYATRKSGTPVYLDISAGQPP
jgi:aminoglycoside phosphotransferase (APT) family kinase protein